MRILIGLIFFSFIFSCVSPPKISNVQIQVLTPVKKTIEEIGTVYLWEGIPDTFKLNLKNDSSFNLNISSIYDCTGFRGLSSYGKYQLKQDSILLHFEKAKGGRDMASLVEAFSNRTIKSYFSECKIKLLSIELKNESCK
ncbi:hypothetical protein [Bernardetia sp. MNP-M8]|uniref:hypothetical protein n=1 Tax=Bernardetia sp. MNP-M8 TaxID=3127470 RepID=UPI0030CACA59